MQKPFLGPSYFLLGTIPSLTQRLTKVGISIFLPLLSIVRIGFLLQLQVVRRIHRVRAVRLGVDIFLFNFLHLRHRLNLCPLPLPHQDHGVRPLIRLRRLLVQMTSKLSLVHPLLGRSPLGYLSSHEAGLPGADPGPSTPFRSSSFQGMSTSSATMDDDTDYSFVLEDSISIDDGILFVDEMQARRPIEEEASDRPAKRTRRATEKAKERDDGN